MNFTLANKKFGKIALILTAISFLWLSTFGLFNHMSEMKPDTTMGGCLFDGQTEVCAMNFSEHIALWQRMLTSLPQNTGLIDLLILSITFIATIAFWRNPLFEFFERVVSRLRLYIKQHSQIYLFYYLLEAFSKGILNPKIYESAII